MKKIITVVITLVMMVGVFTSCSGSSGLLNKQEPKKGDTVATMKTSMGDIKIVLFKDVAPKAVENFTTHAKDGYYDGLTFHRVMNEFMIQGGDPDGNGTGGKSIWDDNFEDEFSAKARNIRGALSMANSGVDTNGSQFFIVQAGAENITDGFLDQCNEVGKFSTSDREAYKELGGTPWLDNKHTVFGQVYEGMDVVDAIAGVAVDANSMPTEEVTIQTIEISEFK